MMIEPQAETFHVAHAPGSYLYIPKTFFFLRSFEIEYISLVRQHVKHMGFM
jgi:hypothetical protein